MNKYSLSKRCHLDSLFLYTNTTMKLLNHTLLYVLLMSYVQLHNVFIYAAFFYSMTSKYLTVVVD